MVEANRKVREESDKTLIWPEDPYMLSYFMSSCEKQQKDQAVRYENVVRENPPYTIFEQSIFSSPCPLPCLITLASLLEIWANLIRQLHK